MGPIESQGGNAIATPYSWVHEGAQSRMLAVLSLLLVASSLWLFSLGRALVTEAAPNGIVSFELAGRVERADVILRSWSPAAREAALLIQGFDSLYLFVYPAWLSLAAVRIARGLAPGWQRIGSGVSWLVLLAAPLDALENHALIQQLLTGPSAVHARVAWICALPKFALAAGAAMFIALAAAVR